MHKHLTSSRNRPHLSHRHPSMKECSGSVSAFEVCLACCLQGACCEACRLHYIHLHCSLRVRKLCPCMIEDMHLIDPSFPSPCSSAHLLSVSCRYQSRGLFFDPPTCGMTHGRWQVQLPQDLHDHAQHQGQKLQTAFDTRQELFGNREDMQKMYTAYIAHSMEQYEHADRAGNAPRRIASCIMEPVIQVRRSGELVFLTKWACCIKSDFGLPMSLGEGAAFQNVKVICYACRDVVC